MFDLIEKNATLTDGQTAMDIACTDGKIAAVAPGITADAKEVIDAGGYLVSPPFIDPHFHMEATLSLGTPRMNVSGTLLEGIALWGELKSVQTVEDIVNRALRYCDLAVSKGIGAIRSHVDTCDDRLTGVEARWSMLRFGAPAEGYALRAAEAHFAALIATATAAGVTGNYVAEGETLRMSTS